jgi:hypothetical protein
VHARFAVIVKLPNDSASIVTWPYDRPRGAIARIAPPSACRTERFGGPCAPRRSDALDPSAAHALEFDASARYRVDPVTKHRIYTTSFASVHPLYVTKVEKKGRTRAEVDQVVRWLTGYTQEQLEAQIARKTDFETFFAEAPALNVLCAVHAPNDRRVMRRDRSPLGPVRSDPRR